jgi:Ran GTPase-activating protein (RanGAP) involved in mRNA processing and transport
MRHCDLNDNFGQVFGDNLFKNKSLQTVDLSHNALSSVSLKSLAHGIAKNKRLQHLLLASNRFDDQHRFIDALAMNT